MRRTLQALVATSVAALIVLPLAGCGEDNDRKPTAAEGAAADVKRQADIDSLNIPQASKDAMKAHIGGGGPTDAAARTSK